jgi:hypothetical protein
MKDIIELIRQRLNGAKLDDCISHCISPMAHKEVMELVDKLAQLQQHGVSSKLTDEEIWQWVEWIDKRCNFDDHQKDYVWFAIRQILKTNSACATAKEGQTGE